MHALDQPGACHALDRQVFSGDERLTVFVGRTDTSIPNRVTNNH
ncbi:hypothetical protein [Streptomyces aureus]|uniref:Uncharacterized protein n=1 Tax=Streptomyces aureus TaxID=193461 RepID=A0ABV4SXX7_9ACTN